MFGRRDRDDDWDEFHKHEWDTERSVLHMDIAGVVCVVGGAVLLCALLACCCRRRRGGVVLSPPPPPPPAPNVPAPYPQQQYAPYPVVVQAAPYPQPFYPVTPHGAGLGGVHVTPQGAGAGLGVGGVHVTPTAPLPSAPDAHGLPPSYEQAVGAAGSMTSFHTNQSSPYNPHFKQ